MFVPLNRLTIALILLTVFTASLLSAQPLPIQDMLTTRNFHPALFALLDTLRSPGKDYSTVFDFELTANEALGQDKVAKLTRNQRTRLTSAFERLVTEEIKRWRGYVKRNVVQYEQEKERASMIVWRGNELVRLILQARTDRWQVVEVENIDEDISLFADAFNEALAPGTGCGSLLAIPRQVPFTRAVKRVDALIAAKGEQPSLLLLKALLLGRKQYEEAQDNIQEWNYDEPVVIKGRNRGQELLQRILTRWPDYAPAHYFYATEEFIHDPGRRKVVVALQRYTQLRTFDPRGWYWLGDEYEKQNNPVEAEHAFQEAVRLAPEDDWCVEGLFRFYLNHDQRPKLLETLRIAIPKGVDVHFLFYELESRLALWQDKEQLRALASLLSEFSDRLAKNKDALRLQATVQTMLVQYEAALETMQMVIQLEPKAEDYSEMAALYRALHRYEEAVKAAQQSLKLDDGIYVAYFHLACAYAQLGRKQEAIKALRQYEDAPMRLIGFSYRHEPDLQPIADMPEFKELTEPNQREVLPVPSKKPRKKK